MSPSSLPGHASSPPQLTEYLQGVTQRKELARPCQVCAQTLRGHLPQTCETCAVETRNRHCNQYVLAPVTSAAPNLPLGASFADERPFGQVALL